MKINELTPLATVESVDHFEAIVIINYKIIINGNETGCIDSRPTDVSVILPLGSKLQTGTGFYNYENQITLTFSDKNLFDIIQKHLKITNFDLSNIAGFSLAVHKETIEQKFRLVEVYNYDKPNLRYGAERFVVCEKLMDCPDYKPPVADEILQKRDELIKEMAEEDTAIPHLTQKEWTNQLIHFVETYLKK